MPKKKKKPVKPTKPGRITEKTGKTKSGKMIQWWKVISHSEGEEE